MKTARLVEKQIPKEASEGKIAAMTISLPYVFFAVIAAITAIFSGKNSLIYIVKFLSLFPSLRSCMGTLKGKGGLSHPLFPSRYPTHTLWQNF